MQRRKFIKDSGLMAVGIGVFGNVTFKKGRFVGDKPTTTDILGPFYRPGAPLRANLNPPDYRGPVLHLSGIISEHEGHKPINKCLVEIWQCKPDKLYDNISDDYSYRASQNVGEDGKYHFITAIPIAYPNDENPSIYRPAHIHMRISSHGHQDLITQVYLKGDPHLESDPSTKSGLSIDRVLSMNTFNDNEYEIKFDITLKEEYIPSEEVFSKVSGVYKMNDASMMEFYRDGDFLLWKWNHLIRDALHYRGDNTFSGGPNHIEAKFELLPQGAAKLQFRFSRRREVKLEGMKVLVYKG